ncbi:HAMP domain-containing histidine kinase [Clostridium sp. CM027]|uniref:sensor histidine kinase n=2 Tax=Clostridium sp. CM027 TaxID=2849865 RepID=UPI001C6F420F|nr:HAMP domain-containing sensor histidine kinase [Clostridium sp. CM027]MBW9146756.1 HAMP domain-containing histidine kinase [Clostridium sp. CM027]UVE41586.1 HAMP domain-containing histidine kinase [Clostridium sp. CM027]
MRIFINYNIRKLFSVVSIILLCFILITQVMVYFMTNQYKKEIITHDYAIAGYLYQQDATTDQIVPAFTGKKSMKDYTIGRELLQPKGYTDSINNKLLPEIQSFHQKLEILVLILSVVVSILLLSTLFIFFVRQDRKLEKANTDILSFMHGNKDIRFSDNEEGIVSQLFSSIDVMATSLTAHITKEKQTKEFLKNTISDISHQLKTPLTALKMYNEIIQEENINNGVVDSFTIKSSNQLERMEYLIRNLLKLARLDADTIELEKSNCLMKDLLECIVIGFSTRAKSEDKSIMLMCNSYTLLNCDGGWILEAFSNIMKNALDHTVSGNEVQILCDETPVLICITIKDNGSGIHPEDIHYIFKRFYRSRFSKDKDGIGIGLTLAKTIVEKHGGSITVESTLNQGTTFYLTFPKLTNL